MRLPIRPVVYLVVGWLLVFLAAEFFVTFKAFVAEPFAFLNDYEEGKKIYEVNFVIREQNNPELTKKLKAANDILTRQWLYEGWQLYLKLSLFAGIVLALILAGNYVIHRYDPDPFNWRKK